MHVLKHGNGTIPFLTKLLSGASLHLLPDAYLRASQLNLVFVPLCMKLLEGGTCGVLALQCA